MERKSEAIADKVEKSESLLDTVLADEYVLSMRTRDAHRNVHGDNFSELRRLFESQYHSLDANVAEVSGVIHPSRSLSSVTLESFLPVTGLRSHNERFTKQDQIIEALLEDHQSIIRSLTRESSGGGQADNDATDLITELLEQHRRMAVALKDWLE